MRRDRVPPALVAVVALLGFLLVLSSTTASANRRAAAPRKARLIELIQERRGQVDELDTAVAQLRSQLTAAEADAAQAGARDRTTSEQLIRLGLQAGTVAVGGPGLEVRLSDSSREPTSAEDAGAFRIHDADIQRVVNALFAAGAEAVSVNDNRIVATSAIRGAGDTIVVNFRPLVPPYRVAAIGARKADFDDSQIATRFRRWTRLFGLGFSVRQTSSLTVPGYNGRVGITSAVPTGAR
jgi:uncharacterized protein YlxW (UPF0749 family)